MVNIGRCTYSVGELKGDADEDEDEVQDKDEDEDGDEGAKDFVALSIPFLKSLRGKVWLMMSSMGSSPAAIIAIAWR